MEFIDIPRIPLIPRPRLSTDKHAVYEDESRSSQVLNEMHRFYQDQRLCDIILHIENAQFKCHRLVLAASSLYFERMFSNDMSEARAEEIRLKDVTSCALQHLVEFSYISKLTLSRDTALEVFEAADMLQFSTARLFCQDFLLDQIDAQNCFNFLLYADAFSSEELYNKAKLCAAENFKSLCHSTEFFALPFTHLVTLLTDNNIDMEYEEHVYEAMRQWIEHDSQDRYKYIAELLKCIRLNYVSRWYLIEIISKDILLTHTSGAQEVVQRAKDQLLAQGHTYEIPWQLPPSRKCTGLTQKIVYIHTYDPTPYESEVYLFDVINKSWSNNSKPCPLASAMSSCENLGNTLLIAGGWNNKHGAKAVIKRGAEHTIHEFKVMSSIFPTLWYVGAHSMGISRYLHSTVVAEDKLYLLGGFDETQSLQASMFVTDADKGYRFDVCPRMLFPIYRPAVAYWERKIYVFGGISFGGVPRQQVQCFDLRDQRWDEPDPGIDSIDITYQYATCINGLFYLLCGHMRDDQSIEDPMTGHLVAQRSADSVYTFAPITGKWELIYKMAEVYHGNFTVTTLNDKIYITGGMKNGSAYYIVDCYDPHTNCVESVGSTREGVGSLSLSTTMKVMHENFGL